MSVSTRNRGTTRYHWRTFISLYWCGHVLSYSSAFVERVCTWLLTSSEINIQKERACQQYMGLSPCLPNCYFKMDYVILAGYSPRLVTRDPWPVTQHMVSEISEYVTGTIHLHVKKDVLFVFSQLWMSRARYSIHFETNWSRADY